MRVLLITIMLLFATVAFGADVVQIADVRGADGKWNNPIAQTVTWETTILTTVPDHQSTSEQVLQNWYFPVIGGYLKASFTRNKIGEYAIRWSHDGLLWSEWNSATIIPPGQAKKG